MDGKKRNETVPQFIYIYTLRDEEEKKNRVGGQDRTKNANNAMKMNCAGFFCCCWKKLIVIIGQCTS